MAVFNVYIHILLLQVALVLVAEADLPTLYEYYTAGGIKTGLSDKQPYFTLNNKNITIYSGAFHYFRVPRAYWRDRLRKMKAAGLNAVETYTPWNIHEPYSGTYDFGNGASDMTDFLHLEEFLQTAKEEDLFAIVRAGPYINSEFEFGGLPSWISRKVKSVRNAKDTWFLPYATRWFNQLIPLLAKHQFQKGGSIILVQVENEYGTTKRNDTVYMNSLKDTILKHGIVELLCTSDPPRNEHYGAIEGVLQTANFAGDPKEMLDWLNRLQTNKPSMAMESYTGWFDHWGDNHHHMSSSAYRKQLEGILDYPASVNMYMFVGSTTYGFLNGGSGSFHNSSGLQPDTSSYDYDAPITESGSYSSKYESIKDIITSHNTVKTKTVDPPQVLNPTQYTALSPEGQLLLSTVLDEFDNKIVSKEIVPMELLDVNDGCGQSYGYVVYRKSSVTIPSQAELKISGFVKDTLLVLLNGQLVSKVPTSQEDLNGFGFWNIYNSTMIFPNSNSLTGATIDLVVENFGRNTGGSIYFKGLTDPIYLNDQEIQDWEIIPLEFKKSWNNNLTDWQPLQSRTATPALYKFTLDIKEQPQDTFLDMQTWTKGIAIVNGFVLGRYFFIGPQQTMFLPAPLLNKGSNIIIVYEHYNAPITLSFSSEAIYDTRG